MKWTKQKKKDNKLFPVLLIGCVFLILAVMILTIDGQDQGSKKPGDVLENSNDDEKDQVVTRDLTGVIKSIDEENKHIILMNTVDKKEYLLEYTGGTNFLNKYGKVSVVQSIPIGEIVEATYNKVTAKLTQIKVSDKAFDYQGISNWRIDQDVDSFVIAESNYKYVEEMVVVRDEKLIGIKELDETDEITIKGFDREIYSVMVTKGHGTLRFSNYEDFYGGIAYIGARYIVPVIEDLIVTVREGKYQVTLEIGDFSGSIPILAVAGEEVLVDMSAFKKPVVETSLVRFVIKPDGADLYVDNLLIDNPLETSLDYGEHTVLVSLGGYTTYTGTLTVEEPTKTVMIDLAESSTEGVEDDDAEDSENADGTTDTDTDISDNDGTNEYEEVEAENYIHVESPEGASVYVNGDFKGSAPVSFPKQNGTLYITLIKSGYTTKTYTVEVKDDDKDVTLDFNEMVIQE
ncbi:MAG: PEGA domain-containing protein [Anaerocolumna sp.]